MFAPEERLEQFLVSLTEACFDGFFTGWSNKEFILKAKKKADELGLLYQSVHAPFYKMSREIWYEGEVGEKALSDLIECAEATSEAEVELMICHAYQGFNTGETPTEIGVERFERLVDRAGELGVKVVFENTEGEEFLFKVMERFADDGRVGFCLDTGHELCYNRGVDLLAKFGKKLMGTHFNDNLGISDYNGAITSRDDLHLLPFDGIVDWEGLARRIVKCGYNGPLAFELGRGPHKNRHDKDKYDLFTEQMYLSEIYARACKVATLIERERNK